MTWLHRLFRPHAELAPALAQRVAAWSAILPVAEHGTLARQRFVVVDVETSGLRPRHDRLLSIGAVAVEALRVRVGETFAAIVRHARPSDGADLLVHGISPSTQAAGSPAEEALMGFLEYAGKDVLVAFHASFDKAILEQAARAALGVRLPHVWFDLAQLAPALFPEARLAGAGLDTWLAHFGLRAHVRHRALDDALATAELFLILLARAAARGTDTPARLCAAADARAYLVPGAAGAGP